MGKRKSKREPSFGEVIVGFAEAIDVAFERLTGKSIAAWLKEFQQRPMELPPGGEVSSSDTMSLVDAYAILGLPLTASLGEVKRNYRNLAGIFHPDKGGYEEAMILLNRAYARITKGGN